MDAAVSDAVIQQAAWKHEEIKNYAEAFVRAGLDLLDRGVAFFGSDDVPEDHIPESRTVPGATVSMLLTANVIVSCWLTDAARGVFGGRRRSKRPSRNGAKVSLYQLRSRQVAETYLQRNGCGIKRGQMELFA